MSLIDRFAAGALCIALAPASFACAIRGGAGFVPAGHVRVDVEHGEGDWRPVLAALQQWLQEPDTAGCRLPWSVALPSQWCRLMMLPWSEALLSKEDAERFARTQYAALYGADARDWTFAIDDAPYGQPRLACAIDAALDMALREAAAAANTVCRSIEPAVFQAWRAADVAGLRAFAVAEQGALTLCSVAGERISSVQAQRCDHDWPVELARAWRRWTLRMPELADIDRVPVLDLTNGPAMTDLPEPFGLAKLPTFGLDRGYAVIASFGARETGLTRLNFAPAAPVLGRWRFALLAVGAMLLAIFAFRWWQQEDVLAKLEAERAQRHMVAAAPQRSLAAQQALDVQAKAIAAAVRDLNLPIDELLDSLQPPEDIRVALLGVDVGGRGAGADEGTASTGVLKVAAEARTAQEMTNYVAFLAENHIFKSVYLVKHELYTEAPEKPYRFVLEVQWRD